MSDGDSSWRDAAACLGLDVRVFYPDDLHDGSVFAAIATAKAVCASCRVQSDCLDFAVRTNQGFGVWGGTTPMERLRVERRARKPKRERSA